MNREDMLFGIHGAKPGNAIIVIFNQKQDPKKFESYGLSFSPLDSISTALGHFRFVVDRNFNAIDFIGYFYEEVYQISVERFKPTAAHFPSAEMAARGLAWGGLAMATFSKAEAFFNTNRLGLGCYISNQVLESFLVQEGFEQSEIKSHFSKLVFREFERNVKLFYLEKQNILGLIHICKRAGLEIDFLPHFAALPVTQVA